MSSSSRLPMLSLFYRFTAVLAGAALLIVTPGCEQKTRQTRRTATTGRVASARETAELLQADFARLDNLPSSFSLRLDPPTILLDARFSSDGKDIQVEIEQAPGVENGPWNVLRVASNNVNLRAAGVRPGDTIKCYLFPDSETRYRQKETGDVDPQMVKQEATDLIVAQVLDDTRVQIVGQVAPPQGLEVRIPESEFADAFSMSQAAMDKLREEGKIDAFGVRIPAGMWPLDQLPLLVTGMQWPPRIEVWRVKDDRVKVIARALGGYARTGEPALGWEPAPDAPELERLIESFNRWLRSRENVPEVEPPSLLQTLPEELRTDRRLVGEFTREAINRSMFQPHEGQLLQEAAWSRDIASWAAGDSFDPLPRAQRLFDWAVRNVTLTESPRVLNHRPWHSLLYAQGTAAQRAWVFNTLCQQQRITSCVIEVNPGQDQPAWLWCGVVQRDQLYLFDPQLGLEIPSRDAVATLEQVVRDDALLRQFDLPEMPYPVTADAAKNASVCVVADLLGMSARAAELQKQQGGRDALALYQPVDLNAEKLGQVPGVGSVKLWEHPFSNLRRRLRLSAATSALAEKTRSAAAADFQPFAMLPRLWKARTLHFRGMLESESEAREKGVLHDPINDHRDAARIYLHGQVRPSERTMQTAIPNAERLALYRRSKTDATYWIALLKQDQREPRQAQSWLENAALDQDAAAHRAIGVRYNLARALESQEKFQQAAGLLRGDQSPQRHGNLIRAHRLDPPAVSGPASDDASEDDPSEDDPSEDDAEEQQ